MKNPGCWANILDDCRGPLTGEHLISVAVWAAPEGQRQNRKSRLRRQVTLSGGRSIAPGQTRTQTVRNLTADILCEHHNNATNDLDEEGGRFARAIEGWFATEKERGKMPRIPWALRTFEADGRLVERWFLKTAVNNTFRHGLPIGSPDAPPGWPSLELVEMVFGLRPVDRPAGLFLLTAVGNTHDFGEQFQLLYVDRNGTHLTGCVLTFRTLRFGVGFERVPIPASVFHRLPGMRGVTSLQPFNAMNSGRSNVELRLRW